MKRQSFKLLITIICVLAAGICYSCSRQAGRTEDGGQVLEFSGETLFPETQSDTGLEYNDAADEWFRLIEPDTSVTYANFYRSALIKLRDIYETGDIRDCNNGKIYVYIRLHEGFKNIYEEA